MTRKEREIQTFLENWRYKLERIEELKVELNDMTVRITAVYDLAPSRSNGSVSKALENFCVRRMEKQSRIQSISDQLAAYEKAIKEAKLTAQEKALVNILREGGSIADYARKKGIYCSYAYKIKDRAISKIGKALDCAEKHTK